MIQEVTKRKGKRAFQERTNEENRVCCGQADDMPVVPPITVEILPSDPLHRAGSITAVMGVQVVVQVRLCHTAPAGHAKRHDASQHDTTTAAPVC